MKLKERISWLMGTIQQSLFPHLNECLPCPLTELEKCLVKILELVCIEKYVPISADRQWLGRPIKEREAIARSFVAKAVMKYQHTRSLRHELQSTPNLRAICGFARRQDVPSESTFSRVKVFSLKNWDELFKWFDVLETGMGVTTENGL